MLRKNRQPATAPEALTAALRLSVTDPNEFLRHRDSGILAAQDKAWTYYGKIGEIHTPLNHAAKEVGSARLRAARYDGKPVDRIEVQDLVDALQAKNGGQAGLLRSYYLIRKVIGEGYLIGYEEKGDIWFDFVSPDEIVTSNDAGGMVGRQGARGSLKRRIRPGINSQLGQDIIEDLPSGSTLIRIWNPHPRFSDLADGPLVAMNEICEELIILTASLKAKIMSRLAVAGVIFLPQGLTTAVAPTEPTGDPTTLTDDPVVDTIVRSMMRGVRNPGDPSSVMPIIIRGPDSAGELIRWITMDREIFDVDIKQREELIRRVRDGLDMQVEVQSGMGEANHWGSWTIQDIHVKVEVGTEVESFCSSVTPTYLWPALEAEGFSPDEAREYKIEGDLSTLTTRPNMAEDARQDYDRGSLSPAALRSYSGALETDKPNGDEYVRWVGQKMSNPALALWGTPEYDEIDWDLVTSVVGKNKPGPNEQNPGEDPSVGPGVGDPGAPGQGESDAPKADRPGGG